MNKFLKTTVWLIFIAPLAYLAIVWNKIPETVATHFNLKGEPDEFSNKSQLWIWICVIAAVSILIYLLLINVHRIDPKKHAAENKDRLLRIAFIIVLFMSFVSIIMIRASLVEGGLRLNIRFVFASVGFMLAIIANYFPNLKPNYFAGLRLPWTLENEENWRKTHWMAGKLWFAGGLIIGFMWLFVPIVPGIIVFFILFSIMIFIPIIYSYRLYKKQKSLNSSNQ
jgi:uncharacterized membrane protein